MLDPNILTHIYLVYIFLKKHPFFIQFLLGWLKLWIKVDVFFKRLHLDHSYGIILRYLLESICGLLLEILL